MGSINNKQINSLTSCKRQFLFLHIIHNLTLEPITTISTYFATYYFQVIITAKSPSPILVEALNRQFLLKENATHRKKEGK